MRFAGRTFPAIGAVIAALAVLAACSGSEEGDTKDRNDAPIGWSTCNALFGEDRIDALQDEMGKGTLAVLNQTFPVDTFVSGSASVVQSWEPGDTGHVAYTASHPCDLGLDGTGKRFNSYVRWSVDTPKGIENGVASKNGWQSAGGDVYVVREDSGLRLTALFPCKIKGSHQEQQAELPLEVETEVRNVPGFDAELLSEMTAQLARNLAKKLPCTNDPEIPSAL
ncbi:hypothetical protein [Streptomyces sp. NPDC003247]|uniref:hypothetical protein n=1 Tax=Streptomyces sp. NPDC003247 TaxID=3364677 RepID=UPI0036980DFA